MLGMKNLDLNNVYSCFISKLIAASSIDCDPALYTARISVNIIGVVAKSLPYAVKNATWSFLGQCYPFPTMI